MLQFARKALLFIVLAELLSLFSFLLPGFGSFAFWTILALFLIISLYKIEWGLYILLAELFVGSKGYLFFFEHSGVAVSIRIAFFIIFASIWFVIMLNQERRQKLIAKLKQNKKIINYYLLIIVFIIWGFVWGLIRGNSYDNIFFDFNAWLFFILFFPFLNLINSKQRIAKVITVFITAVTWTALKTFSALYIFSHQYFNVRPFYKWLRDSGIGEVTLMNGGFSRIFFQSHIYVLIGIFIISTILVYKLIKNEKNNYQLLIINYLLFSTIITSLSRSFWVGLISGLIILFVYLIFKEKVGFKKVLKVGGGLVATLIISVVLIFVVVKIPPTTSDVYGSMFEQRFTQIDAAGSSRINQLGPLFKKIAKHPIIGSGFGATVTYQSNDPRIKTDLNPEGWYTTYAFEWGYLDIILKIGLVGLGIYLYFIYLIIKLGYKFIIKKEQLDDKCQMINGKYRVLTLGLVFGLIALAITNIFSPYLNHPLGIGYILLCGAIFQSENDA